MTKSIIIGISFYLTLFISHSTWATPNSLLKCLGAEEERYHKEKANHARAKLNTEVITELAQTSELSLKDQYFDIICGKRELFPSERLLEMQLLHGTDIFNFYGRNHEISQALMVEYQKSLPQVFLRHLGNLQSELETPNCLDKKIAPLARIKEKIKYTEEEVSGNALSPLKSEITKTFNELKKFEQIKIECRLKEEKIKNKKKTK